MITKTRSDFMPTVISNNVPEKDLLLNHWDQFEIKRPLSYYQIVESDIQRPDLLSLRVYNNYSYWWILMKFNGISDVWNDLTPGDVIKCPHILDCEMYTSLLKL
jgi:hypothetical protein